jgi:hypothetical protein
MELPSGYVKIAKFAIENGHRNIEIGDFPLRKRLPEGKWIIIGI